MIMKELSIGEKAKRYDEAITRAKDFMNGEVHYALRRGENIMCWIFSELRESEDERIKRDIIEVLRYGLECEESVLMPGATTTLKEATAWLEKQDSQNLDNSAKTCKDEHKHAWSENDEIALGDALWCCKQAAIIAKDENDMGNIWYAERWLKSIKERIQPQQEWSEEDSPYYDDICEILINLLHSETADVNKDAVQKDLDWLISLEERVQPQPKQEWSEEDELIIGKILCICDDFEKSFEISPASTKVIKEDVDKIDTWLKSLRPQNTWKPSDEQMADLWNMVCECRPADQQLLQDIYYGLKTLRGE